jgi:hypothetical protein
MTHRMAMAALPRPSPAKPGRLMGAPTSAAERRSTTSRVQFVCACRDLHIDMCYD